MNDKIRDFLIKAYAYAKQSFERLFENQDTHAPADKSASLAMAAACTAQFSAAAAVYLSRNTVHDENILNLFRQFERFVKEVRTVYHQPQPNATTLFFEMDRLEALMLEHGFDV